MKAIENRFNDNPLIKFLPMFVLLAELCAGLTSGSEVRFDYVRAVDNKTSLFTNTADIDGDGKLDILAFKGGSGYISWYKYPSLSYLE